MELYILKSAGCLVLLFAFYKLFLENTSIHNFKRLYLSGSLLASFLIPLITFTTYAEASPFTTTYTEATPQQIFIETDAAVNFWPLVLWTAYGLGILIFILKFFKNLFNLVQKIRKNPRYRNSSFIIVLLNETIIPHTFFSYIFLNKKQYDNHEIPAEVMLHEEAHARQKHSLDVLFVQVLQILFWFNPLFYFIKRSIKLNHEFLADRAVLNAGTETSEYQKVLLAFSSPDSYQDAQTPSLAHSINYSSIKKRFTVMKTHTSKRAIWFRSLLLLPLLSILIYGFSTKEVVAKHSDIIPSNSKVTLEKPFLKVHVIGDKIIVNDKEITLSNFTETINAVTKDWSKIDFKLYSLDIKEENVSNTQRLLINAAYKRTNLAMQSDYNNGFILGSSSDLKPLSAPPSVYNNFPGPNRPIEHVLAMENQNARFHYNSKIINVDQAILLLKGNENMAVRTQLQDPAPPMVFIYNKSTNSTNTIKATKEEIAEYNRLAKKYNAVVIEKRIIKKKDLERLEFIYKKMTDEQKADAEPFPECIPRPPTTNTTIAEDNKKFSEANYYSKGEPITFEKANELLEKNNNFGIYIDKSGKYPGNIHLYEEPFDIKKISPTSPPTVPVVPKENKREKSNIPPPPPSSAPKVPSADNGNIYTPAQAPPPPNSNMVEYVKELAKKGATFYIGPHKYSADEAIKMVEKSTKDVTIDVSKYPLVYLGGC